MRSLLLAALFVYAIDAIFGVSVVIKNNTVLLDDKPVDLTKLEVIEDLPFATRYLLHSGDSNITITKSKFGNAISVASQARMTPEEAEKMKEFHANLTKKIENKVKTIQDQVDSQIKKINDQISQNFKNVFSGFSLPFF